jgi:phosphate transport system permease protein
MKTRTIESAFAVFAWSCGGLLFSAVSCVILFLIAKGFRSVSPELIFGSTNPVDALLLRKQVFDGLFPAIAGTFSLVIISVAIAIPLGIATGIYMAEYAGGILKSAFSLFYDILAAVPSVLVGLFGFSAAIWLHRNVSETIYPCMLISAFSLAFLVLPYIIRTTQVTLENLPQSVRLTALSLGASKLQNIFYVLIPCAVSGIISGIILAIGRCAEDTAVIMLTGVVATAGVPKSILGSYEALPFYIYYISSQYMDSKELSTGYGASLILLGVCISLYLTSYLIKTVLQRRFATGGHRL